MSEDLRSLRPVNTVSQSKATSISTSSRSSVKSSMRPSSQVSHTSAVHSATQTITRNHDFASVPVSSIHSASASRHSLPVKLPQSLSASVASDSAARSLVSPSSSSIRSSSFSVLPSSSSAPPAKSSVTPVPSSKSSSLSAASIHKLSDSSSVVHQGGVVGTSGTPSAPKPSGTSSASQFSPSASNKSPSQTSDVNVLKTAATNSFTLPGTSSQYSSGHSSALVGAPTAPPGTITNAGSTAAPNAFLAHKATAGGILAVAAIMLIAVVAAMLMFCRRKRGIAKTQKHRRWQRGISWPTVPDSDGGYDPFFVAPRTAPAPPMTEMYRDAVLSRETIGSPVSASAVQPNPFDRVAPPPRIATSTVLSQRMDTPTSANFGYPFRTMYPDQPLDAQTAAVQAPSIHESANSSVHRLTPSLRESSPSMYEASLPDDDDDSLYTRETQGTGQQMDPFRDQATGPLSPSASVFNVARKPVPPLPPRHRSRPSLSSVMTPPTSDTGHYNLPPSSYFPINDAGAVAQGLGLSIIPTSSQQSEDSESNLMTPTRRTFLNIRPKRGSLGASSAGGSV